MDEIDTLNRLVVIFLETAELRAKNKLDITMAFWKENINRMLEFSDKKILTDSGTISNAQMEEKVKEIYEVYDSKRKSYEALNADEEDIREIEEKIKSRKKI